MTRNVIDLFKDTSNNSVHMQRVNAYQLSIKIFPSLMCSTHRQLGYWAEKCRTVLILNLNKRK